MVYRDVLISGGWNRGVLLYTEVSSLGLGLVRKKSLSGTSAINVSR